MTVHYQSARSAYVRVCQHRAESQKAIVYCFPFAWMCLSVYLHIVWMRARAHTRPTTATTMVMFVIIKCKCTHKKVFPSVCSSCNVLLRFNEKDLSMFWFVTSSAWFQEDIVVMLMSRSVNSLKWRFQFKMSHKNTLLLAFGFANDTERPKQTAVSNWLSWKLRLCALGVSKLWK